MATKWVSLDRLRYAVSKIYTLLGGKVDKADGLGLSSNDFTTDEKTKLAGIAAGANAYAHPAHTAYASGLYKIAVNTLGHVTAAAAVAKADITALGIPAQDTTYPVMGGAAASAAGSSGLVPAPAAGKQAQFLRGDGTWAAPDDTVYNVASSSANGLMSSSDKAKLDAFASASSYALKSDISQMYCYKGSVASASALPSSGLTAGDVYDIQTASDYGPAGTNVAWTGEAWDALGGVFSLDECTNAEIDAIFTDLAG